MNLSPTSVRSDTSRGSKRKARSKLPAPTTIAPASSRSAYTAKDLFSDKDPLDVVVVPSTQPRPKKTSRTDPAPTSARSSASSSSSNSRNSTTSRQHTYDSLSIDLSNLAGLDTSQVDFGPDSDDYADEKYALDHSTQSSPKSVHPAAVAHGARVDTMPLLSTRSSVLVPDVELDLDDIPSTFVQEPERKAPPPPRPRQEPPSPIEPEASDDEEEEQHVPATSIPQPTPSPLTSTFIPASAFPYLTQMPTSLINRSQSYVSEQRNTLSDNQMMCAQVIEAAALAAGQPWSRFLRPLDDSKSNADPAWMGVSMTPEEQDHLRFRKEVEPILTAQGRDILGKLLSALRDLIPLGSRAAKQPAHVLFSHPRYEARLTEWLQAWMQYKYKIIGDGADVPRTRHQTRCISTALEQANLFFLSCE